MDDECTHNECMNDMRDAGEAPCTDECLRLCIRAGRLIYHWLSRFLETVDLTPIQYEVLDILHRQRGGSTLTGLRRQLCCAGSNVTAIIDRMERDGLVQRRRDSRDRRVVRVVVTRVGRGRLDRVHSDDLLPSGLGEILTREQQVQLIGLLGPIVGKIAAQSTDDASHCHRKSQ